MHVPCMQLFCVIYPKTITSFLQESLQIDPLCMGCLYEAALQDGNLDKWKETMRLEKLITILFLRLII